VQIVHFVTGYPGWATEEVEDSEGYVNHLLALLVKSEEGMVFLGGYIAKY